MTMEQPRVIASPLLVADAERPVATASFEVTLEVSGVQPRLIGSAVRAIK